MGLSRRAYARHRDVSHTAVEKALRAGRIGLLADGTIDPEAADLAWNAAAEASRGNGTAPADPRRVVLPAGSLAAARGDRADSAGRARHRGRGGAAAPGRPAGERPPSRPAPRRHDSRAARTRLLHHRRRPRCRGRQGGGGLVGVVRDDRPERSPRRSASGACESTSRLRWRSAHSSRPSACSSPATTTRTTTMRTRRTTRTSRRTTTTRTMGARSQLPHGPTGQRRAGGRPGAGAANQVASARCDARSTPTSATPGPDRGGRRRGLSGRPHGEDAGRGGARRARAPAAAGLPDTPGNRRRLERLRALVGAVIRAGQDPSAVLDDHFSPRPRVAVSLPAPVGVSRGRRADRGSTIPERWIADSPSYAAPSARLSPAHRRARPAVLGQTYVAALAVPAIAAFRLSY